MTLFNVTALEHHNKTIRIEAASEDDAMTRVARGEGTVIDDTVTESDIAAEFGGGTTTLDVIAVEETKGA